MFSGQPGIYAESNRTSTLPGDEGVSGWLSPPHLISRDQVGSTCPRAQQQQRELLLQQERRVNLTHDTHIYIYTWYVEVWEFKLYFTHPPTKLLGFSVEHSTLNP